MSLGLIEIVNKYYSLHKHNEMFYMGLHTYILGQLFDISFKEKCKP